MPSKPRRKITVLLADDHRLVREGLRSTLASYDFLAVAGEAVNGNDALKKIKKLKPDIVLMDLDMPGMDGLDATAIIQKKFPGTRVIALTMHDNKEFALRLFRSGAQGYVLKDASPQQLVRAIECVIDGGTFFSRSLARDLQNFERTAPKPPPAKLTKREKDVLALIANGRLNKETAADLGVSVRTVETYRARLKRKLRVSNTAELIKFALQKNLVH